MAGLAGCGEFASDVIDNRSQKILLMAGVARGRQTCELTSGSTFMTLLALYHCVRTNQWKPVLMVANGID